MDIEDIEDIEKDTIENIELCIFKENMNTTGCNITMDFAIYAKSMVFANNLELVELVIAQIKSYVRFATVVDANGSTILEAVIEMKHMKLTEKFMIAGDHSDPNLLTLAILHDVVNAVRAIILTDTLDLNEMDYDGYNFIYYAVRKGNMEIVIMLIEAGVDVNIVYDEGITLLEHAIAYEAHEEAEITIVQVLLDAGANPNLQNSTTLNTALHIAAIFDTCVKNILEAGVNVNTFNMNRETAFHCSILGSSMQTINMMVEAGADLNALDRDNNTPFFLYIKDIIDENTEFDLAFIKRMIRRGANIPSTIKDTMVIKAAVAELEIENKELIIKRLVSEKYKLLLEIEELKSAPPREGGEYYKSARDDFESICYK